MYEFSTTDSMLRDRGVYNALEEIAEDEEKTIHRADIPQEQRGTLDRLLHRPNSMERSMTLDSIRSISPVKPKGTRHDQHTSDLTPELHLQHRSSLNKALQSSSEEDRQHFLPRSLSYDVGRQLTETEKRYLASLDERRGALDTKMLPPLVTHKHGRNEVGRCSLPTCLEDTSDIRPKTPKNISRLHHEDSFGMKEELYKVDMDDGHTYVCRKRAGSITNPDIMTGDERRIHDFLARAARLGSISSEASLDIRAQSNRVYGSSDGKLIVDHKMSKYAAPRSLSRRRSKHHLKSPPPLLPPIYQQVTRSLVQRDYTISPGPRVVPPITDATWEELKECRYLRPPAKRFQDIPEDFFEDSLSQQSFGS